MRFNWCSLWILFLLFDRCEGQAADAVVNTNHLLLDGRVIEATSDVRLVLGKVEKDEHNPLFGADRPWERRLDNVYANVWYDREAKVFHCWYSPFIIDPATEDTPRERRQEVTYDDAMRAASRSREMALCYASSTDGITWQKPALNLFEFNGSRENNLVLRIPGDGEGPHGSGVTPIERTGDLVPRFKAVFSRNQRLWLTDSFDGVRWSTPFACLGVKLAGDTHNHLLWDPRHKRYVAFSRIWNGGVRQVARIESVDLHSWSPVRMVLEGMSPQLQVYTVCVFPSADVYLGLIMILNTETDRVHCELAWSPDTVDWHRICPGTPLIENGESGSCDYGCVYAGSPPIVQQDQMHLYYGCSNDLHGGWRESFLCRGRLPVDRWAGYRADATQHGKVLTREVLIQSESLLVNADAEKGSLTVEVLDADGKAVAKSQTVRVDQTKHRVDWESDGDLRMHVGKRFRLRFQLNDATLYSFAFSKD